MELTTTFFRVRVGVLLVGTLTLGWVAPAWANNSPITAEQRQSAKVASKQGVPESYLADNVPSSYVVKSNDTLWDISKMYLKSPWCWPSLWGINMDSIRDPHHIYPGQVLHLVPKDGYATLQLESNASNAPQDVLKLSPQIRSQSDGKAAPIPTLRDINISKFLDRPLIVSPEDIQHAPRIVNGTEEHFMYGLDDKILVASNKGQPLVGAQGNVSRRYSVFHNAKPIKDPQTGTVLGLQIQPVGSAHLLNPERAIIGNDGKIEATQPAEMRVIKVTAEILPDDRVLPDTEDESSLDNVTLHAPTLPVRAHIVEIYGNGVTYAGSNQIVILNYGHAQGANPGEILAIERGETRKTILDPNGKQQVLKLPAEKKGLVIVFRVFDKLSYALILQATEMVEVNDLLINP